jgi:hypothetical protein
MQAFFAAVPTQQMRRSAMILLFLIVWLLVSFYSSSVIARPTHPFIQSVPYERGRRIELLFGKMRRNIQEEKLLKIVCL